MFGKVNTLGIETAGTRAYNPADTSVKADSLADNSVFDAGNGAGSCGASSGSGGGSVFS